MIDVTSLIDRDMFSTAFVDQAKRNWIRTSRILILVDGRLSVEPFPAPVIGQEFVISNEFGISVAIGELKRFAQGFSYFTVTVATRDGDGSPIRGHDMADGAPTQYGTTRYTTTRPATFAETIGAAVIPAYENEGDYIPQAIEWVPFSSSTIFERPHPLLCHPKLGPINVLPDHMHEGRCFDFSDPAWISSKGDLTFNFDGYQNAYFPTVAGNRPLPTVVAWGSTPADPPLNYFNGDQPYRRFPDIAAYDGQQIGLGRVVVDSTWHHWFDLNLEGITKRAIEDGDRTVIDKILRYYVNVGIYLAAPSWRAGMALGLIKLNQFKFFGRQIIDLSASTQTIGQATGAFLANSLGRCLTMEFVLDQLLERPDLARWWRSKLAEPTAAKIDLTYQSLEDHVLGETVRTLYGDMAELREQIAKTGELQSTPLFKTLDRTAKAAAVRGFQQAVDMHATDLSKARVELMELTRWAKRTRPAKTV